MVTWTVSNLSTLLFNSYFLYITSWNILACMRITGTQNLIGLLLIVTKHKIIIIKYLIIITVILKILIIINNTTQFFLRVSMSM